MSDETKLNDFVNEKEHQNDSLALYAQRHPVFSLLEVFNIVDQCLVSHEKKIFKTLEPVRREAAKKLRAKGRENAKKILKESFEEMRWEDGSDIPGVQVELVKFRVRLFWWYLEQSGPHNPEPKKAAKFAMQYSEAMSKNLWIWNPPSE